MFRCAACLGFGYSPLLSISGSTLVRAQAMYDDEIAIPWFRSTSEIQARRVCEADLPECSDSVRLQLAIEKVILALAPYIVLCRVILVIVRYASRKEALRGAHHREAAEREPRRWDAEQRHLQKSHCARTSP